MADVDVTELARSLERTAAGLKRHIADEARKRAAELGKTYAKAADERIKDNAVELQRAQDLVRELRRQMKPLEEWADKCGQLAAVIRTASWSGETAISVKTLLDILNAQENQHARDHQT